nr:C69 family dipeptidase [Maliibacterium massiliense]
MCDTFVVTPAASADHQMLFAKASDRSPNEPSCALRLPPVDYAPGTRVRCTYIEIDQAPHTYGTLLFKPSWMWGCEMGANEHGLNIGNEAVFTRLPCAKEGGLTGMDLARLALERCRTPRQAVDTITGLLARHGQGGNCSFDGTFYYHNSFLIADASEAWVLETAGPYWAAKKVEGIYAISNALTIHRKYDLLHPDVIAFAGGKGWCTGAADFDFAKCFTDPVRTAFAHAGRRRRLVTAYLAQRSGRLTPMDMAGALRQHSKRDVYKGGSGSSVCMHAGARPGASHTTAAYIAHLGPHRSTYYLTGASLPCTSMFKPYWLEAGETQLVLPPYAQSAAVEAWLWRERLPRAIMQRRLSAAAIAGYMLERDKLEARWFAEAEEAHRGASGPATLPLLARQAVQEEIKLLSHTLEVTLPRTRHLGGPMHRHYWRRKDATLGQRRPQSDANASPLS